MKRPFIRLLVVPLLLVKRMDTPIALHRRSPPSIHSSPQRGRTIAVFFGTSFLLHLLWENAQAPLFQGYESFVQHFPICLKATATGDMLFMLVIYCALALANRDMWWPSNPKTFRRPATWILPPVIGIFLAISFELWAIHVARRWTYAEAMPIIPILQVGILPLLQMMIVPLLSLFLASRSTRPL